MEVVERLASRKDRLVAGVMSGTSADGADVALARIEGSGRDARMEMLAFVHRPYDDVLRDVLLRNAEAATSSVRQLALLNALLARRFGEAVEAACEEAGVPMNELDLIGSHGHTFQHIPVPQAIAGEWVSATFQLGDGPTLAVQTGVPVISNFRSADVALGGQGAPLVPYFDWAVFADDQETRALLNLGGIANLTLVPAGGDRAGVMAFDSGPANMIIDALARRLLGTRYDKDGSAAARGTVNEDLLATLLEDVYFSWPPPKSTGRERFGLNHVEMMVASRLPAEDLLATASALTVRTIADALEKFVTPRYQPDVLIVSGGGVRNSTVMRWLAEAVAPIPLRTSDEYGVAADAKESLCFALMAHEYANGVHTSLPAVTGAKRSTLQGELALP
jgi:anhydro-N-acetylmuramic acid kinase